MVNKTPYATQIRSMGKFMSDNHFPRYLLFGIILLKSVSIYGKMKQMVAINAMSSAIMTQQGARLRQFFDSEEELQDLITKRLLE